MNFLFGIAFYSQIVWLGDLNYRLNLMDNEIRLLVAQEDWTSLFKEDQVSLSAGFFSPGEICTGKVRIPFFVFCS